MLTHWKFTVSDTIGNAYFARCAVTDPRPQMRNLVVVTSEFHMPRTQRIFEWVFGLPPHNTPYTLAFESVPDIGMSPKDRDTRRQKESKGCQNVEALALRITCLETLCTWLYTQHSAYSTAGLLAQKPPASSNPALNTY